MIQVGMSASCVYPLACEDGFRFANLAGFGAPWMLGVVKTNAGSFTSGLLAVAAIEALTLLIILVFIPKRMTR